MEHKTFRTVTNLLLVIAVLTVILWIFLFVAYPCKQNGAYLATSIFGVGLTAFAKGGL